MSKILISDIHGCYKTLKALVDKLPHKNIAILGDLVDRGPRSMEVVQYIMDNKFDCIKGNHEQMMLDYYDNKEFLKGLWLRNGGIKTRESYANVDLVLLEHLKWMEDLPTYIKYSDIKNDKGDILLISHSMAFEYFKNPDLFNDKERDLNIMWNRDFHKIKPISGMYNIFGHTPQYSGVTVKTFYSCIDTGACYRSLNKEIDRKEGFGILSAIEYPSMKVWTQENIDENS